MRRKPNKKNTKIAPTGVCFTARGVGGPQDPWNWTAGQIQVGTLVWMVV